ncbi:Asp-tRNA(Asn)/Glu-tRNA(Gln) amidotransferase GatCAB subunit B [Mycoplasmopsis pullorum]|uniref:Asp-tRNA(Asn)/Glu-tRNA(Gln) amidotransferase subunit GatB n=1 Tax=Mycoplasmopsis pullorum TaxID=48003 RepID=UPI00111A5A7C|nr:Asp-tRNA(Asn)/Glu-tRNA(Gln) amidotransferase subunit GatB [Mycoplasmopsis pullorum]TNK83336.1 Asp-tRNA(Asn)/Glu-tRNA(Gln) amidotransferase GatCAB subunit B [Mycoplasmopsis pullorum]TNK92356.1 Asp-tRNA(Asn)/Glu-tRNA(Gln) amidotransferase GatCAB subunit B [Mycoplasmopsis pullorum]
MKNNFEVIIGIEIHVELSTKTKMFSPIEIDFNAQPNTKANQIDLGYPGTLPLINKQAVKNGVALAKALQMEIDDELHFDRKNYFYTDLPKGYQITQFYRPIGKNGQIQITLENGQNKLIDIERIHLEEDTARQHHVGDVTELDYNRAGVPLIEIVTYPVMRSAEEAALYVDAIRQTVLALGISNAKLEQGSLRADVNISLRPYGYKKFGTKVEIKNLNSLSNIKKAIEKEIDIQYAKIMKNEPILQQTKRFDDSLMDVVVMRTKTGEVDYKYFPEPNIPFIKLSKEFIDSVQLPELPWDKKNRYESENINNIYIQSLVNDLQLAEFFDSIIYSDRDKLSKVFFAEVVSLANAQNVKAYELGIKAENIAQAMELLDSEIISGKSLKKLVPLLVQFNGDINKLLDEHQLKQIIDKNVIELILSEIISENEETITKQLDRPERVLKMILGAAMKKTGGQISPTLSDEIAKDLLKRKFSI